MALQSSSSAFAQGRAMPAQTRSVVCQRSRGVVVEMRCAARATTSLSDVSIPHNAMPAVIGRGRPPAGLGARVRVDWWRRRPPRRSPPARVALAAASAFHSHGCRGRQRGCRRGGRGSRGPLHPPRPGFPGRRRRGRRHGREDEDAVRHFHVRAASSTPAGTGARAPTSRRPWSSSATRRTRARPSSRSRVSAPAWSS